MKNLLMSKDRKLRLFLVVSFAVLLVGAMPLSGQSAGYDLLQTGSGASVDLSSVGLGNVALQGVPIQSSTGSTDTIMHRTQDVIGGGTTPVNVTALFMKSTSSKTFQGQQVDVYVTLNNSGGAIPTSVLPQPDSLSASTGTATFRTDGTFDSSITVNADVIFVRAGTSVTNSANYVGHQAASSITLTSSGSSWSSTPPAGYPSSSTFPSGGIYPRPVHNGPHPVVPSTCNTTLSPASPTSPTTASASRPGAAKNGAQTIGDIAVKACISSAQ
jgi:hypothetical protein